MLSKASLAFFLATALAAPSAFPGLVLHEKRDVPAKRWVKNAAVDAAVILPMRIGMVQPNIHKGHELLMDVSDPDSPNYSKWYSQEDIIDMFAPKKHSVDAIRVWLESSGIESHRISQSANKQWVQFDATTAEAEELFKTKYHYYEHTATGSKNIACDEYHLPEHLAPHVDYITPGLRLMHGGKVGNKDLEKRLWRPSPPQRIKGPAPALHGLDNPSLLALCDIAMTPICIQTEYNITKGTSAYKGNELGIFESLNDYLSISDLQQFFTEFQAGIIPPDTRPTLKGIDGGIDNMTGPAGPESNLDFQISYPIIHPQNSILFQTDDYIYETEETTGQVEGFLNTFLDALDGSYCKEISPLDPVYPDPSNQRGAYKGKLQCGVYKPTNVISISYGGQEDDLPASYQTRQCNEFLKLGLQGVSTLISSGDSGVAGPPGDDGNDDGCLGKNGQVFSPDFPATCPYITSVGATVLVGKVQADEETAVTRFPSGGGFSNIYPIPDYQKHHVAAFLEFESKNTSYPTYSVKGTSNPSPAQVGKGIFNKAGRGYPDVSAVGDNVVIVYEGQTVLIGGTSCAAPTWGAILTRINEERLRAGKKTVGFINPILYKNDHVFHDITVGSNPGCGTDGFYATKGWDPLTGLGTPNYPELLKLFMSCA